MYLVKGAIYLKNNMADVWRRLYKSSNGDEDDGQHLSFPEEIILGWAVRHLWYRQAHVPSIGLASCNSSRFC